MLRLGPVTAFAILLALPPALALGQLPEADRSRLAAEVEAAAGNLDASAFPDLDRSKSELLRRVKRVREYFARSTTAENRDAWFRYLELEPLVDAIQEDDSPTAIARHAMDLRYRLVGTSPGLELTVLRRLRESVEQLIEAVRFLDKQRSKALLAKQLESIAELIRELDDIPSADDFASISYVTRLLQGAGQAAGLIGSLRSTFGRPNAAVLVGQPMIQTALNRDVRQRRPVRDCILGTRIVGNASMEGLVTAELIPSPDSARIQMTLTGQIVSNSFGYNGPVRLRTVGFGDVNATRSLKIDDGGITLEPVEARGVLRTEIRAIEHPLRIVRKIARKKAARQKPRADRIAEARMRRQVAEQFGSQTKGATSVAPPDMLARVRPLIQRLSLQEPSRLWSSTEQALVIDSTFRRRDQLAAVVPRPPITDSYHVALQIHESVIDNAFAPVLSGRTLNENQINHLLADAGRPARSSDDEEEAEPEPPFEIDFARLRPIIFEARSQTLRLGVRGTRFRQGNRELKQSMEITAVYEPAKTPDGVAILRRSGEVDVDFLGRKRLTVSQAGLKPTIKKKFSNVFPEVVLDRPLEVSQKARLEAIRGRVFHASLIDARDGWLTVAIR